MPADTLRPVGTEFTYVYPPSLIMSDTEGHSLHAHEWTYRVKAHVWGLEWGKPVLMEEWEPLRERCLDAN